MRQQSVDWRNVLLVVGAGGGALLAFGSALALVAYGLWPNVSPDGLGGGRPALDYIVLGSALLVIGAVFVPSVYHGIQAMQGRSIPAADPKVLRVWQGVVLVLVWLAAAVGAGLLVDKPVVKWVTPLLYVLAIGIPVYFFVRLAAGGLHPGSKERWWGVLAAGIALGITPAIVLELLLALVALIGVGIYVGLNPDQLAAFQQLASQLQTTTDLDQLMKIVQPWATSPLVVVGALVFFSVFSPIIEETAKSLAVWSVFDRLRSPAQGFAIGSVSGAAFGMVESLLVSATPDTNWTTTLLVRGASTMMHIMAAGLTGWGIGQFRVQRNPARLVGMYLAAMTLHGLWNAAVVAIAFGSLRTAVASSGTDALGILMMFAGAALLLLLFLGIPLGMATINWRLRRLALAAQPAVVAPARAGDIGWATGDPLPPAEEDTAPRIPPGDGQAQGG